MSFVCALVWLARRCRLSTDNLTSPARKEDVTGVLRDGNSLGRCGTIAEAYDRHYRVKEGVEQRGRKLCCEEKQRNLSFAHSFCDAKSLLNVETCGRNNEHAQTQKTCWTQPSNSRRQTYYVSLLSPPLSCTEALEL